MSPNYAHLTTPREILDAALAKEEHAYQFYDDILSHAKVGMIRDLVEELRQQEAVHVRLIKARIVQLDLGRG